MNIVPLAPQLLPRADSNQPVRPGKQAVPGGRPGRRARWQTAAMEAGLRVQDGGSGEPLLVLLHGLGATGDVWCAWRPLLARRWPGRT